MSLDYKEKLGQRRTEFLPLPIFGLVFYIPVNVSCFAVKERKLKMDTTRLIRNLRGEKGRIERAIAALEALSGDSAGSQTTRTAGANKAGRRKMSVAGRKRISEMMKKRWVARRKEAKKA